ncbi:hypothetical protein C8034_v008899 [Colletotrichum sidae]|uniref:Uncharacterized protein n=4 Tax=Colletotrichum orbiculare species complex TaxID=2707354 RepID=N4V027_COLOR|nr:hypothetical protein Cob_v004256 [Colletotrichum orbiculare MAFF 240422]TDZ40571.1 hypothetical protein C8035_v005517 [Colletotrichum spinosum]TDZ51829.1 hypothetical protein CTRI78_v007306 [Colletotrichum trifolii]TEA10738.1 hypothetical protein C8034_v008899 [Colletotrichum sidae]
MPSSKNQDQLKQHMSSGIRFKIKSGNATYECNLQERSAFERARALRTNSSDSQSTVSTTSSSRSSTKSGRSGSS